MTTDLALLSAADLAPLIAAGEASATDVAEACLDCVAAREPAVQAWAFIDPGHVRAQAAALDAARAAGRPTGPLHGVPVGLKDVIDTADMPTGNGTPADAGRKPSRDAAVVAALRAAGAVVMGKTVTAELAHREPGPTTNPLDPARTPGGSSSGSAAAVAAGMAPLAVGTQTGGSVIRPAAYCGIVGFKPSLHLIPAAGVFRRSHTMDTMGVFARTVGDAALIAGVLAGEGGADLLAAARAEPDDPPRFALVRQPAWDTADDDMKAAFARVGKALGDGAAPAELPPPFDGAAGAHRTISLAELSHYVEPYVARAPDALSDGMRRDVAEGASFPAVDYIAALETIEDLNAALEPLFAEYDALITPAAAGQALVGLGDTGSSAFCSIWTLCGTPAISLPLLTGADGMPMGLQLVGRRGEDAKLLQTASWLMRRLANEGR